MTDEKRPEGSKFAWVDPQRAEPADASNNDVGISGTGYSLKSERAEGEKLSSGNVDAHAPARSKQIVEDGARPDAGRRASFDPKTGKVHGGGAGAGGGNPGEDFDSDPMSGDGYPLTGGEGRTSDEEHDLGPSHILE